MKKYCFTCGAKLEYSPSDKPNFCPKCGKSLGSPGENVISASINEDDDEEDGVAFVPNISKLDFDFDIEASKNTGEKLSSIMGTLDESQVGKNKMPTSNNVTKEEIMEQFKREAGALKKDTKKKDAQT